MRGDIIPIEKRITPEMIGKLRVWLIGALVGASVGASAKDYALVKDGTVRSCIVLPDNAGPVEKHAASELCAYLEKITGARVETMSSPAAGTYGIYIGAIGAKDIPLTPQMRASAAKVGEEGYLLAADSAGLRIVGKKPIGALYGVYGLLRRYGEVRWFFPGVEGEYCPKRSSFAVPSGVVVSNPSFSTRTLNLVCANINSKITDTWDWMARNGMHIATSKTFRKDETSRNYVHLDECDKRGAKDGGGGHAFSYLISDSLFDEHPEYFALIDGKRMKQEGQGRQPCTSNPEVVEIMTAKLLEWGEIPPRGGTFLIGNNDSPGWCQCENCTRLDPPAEKEKSFVSTRYWTLLNAIAEKALAQNSDLKLQGWAYQNFQEPPVGIVPDKRFAVWACLHQRCYRHRMDDETCPSNRRFREDILLKWSKLNPTYTYEYTDCLPGGDVIYLPLEHVFADDLKYYHKIGVRGSLTETAPPDGVFGPVWDNRRTKEMWLATWPFVYMMASFLWDVDADYNTVYEDMGSKFYGVAWPAMKQYRGKLTKAYEETPGEMIYGTPDIALGKCLDRPGLEADLLKLLDNAEKAAAGNDALLKKIRREREYLDLSWRKMHKEYVAKSKLEVGASRSVGNITVDGQLDEPDWKKADFITGFVAQNGDKADPQTFVRILFDNDNVYFGVESLEADPAKMKTLVTKRDGPLWTDNGVEFFIAAPIGNGKYLHLIVNSRGARYDSMATGTGPGADVGFDSGAEVKTAALPDRWVVEARIPTSALGTTIKDGEVWKLNVARNRVLTDGTSQGSSLCDGAYHGVEAFRSVAFGGKGLIQNGDFEDVQKPSEWKQKTKWKFQTDAAPACWSFHDYAGEAALIEGGAASGRKYLRIKSVSDAALAVICQSVNLQAADSLLVRAKVRGKGVVRAVMFLYDQKTYRHLGSPFFGDELKVNSPNWTTFEATYNHDGKTRLTLALYFSSTEGIDVDDVTVVRGKKL